MLTRVSKLPRDDRWDALARGAMRDDLYAVLESLTRSVLVASDGGDTPAKRFEYWADANRDALKRAKTALHGVERLDNAGLAALSVALRTLRVGAPGRPARLTHRLFRSHVAGHVAADVVMATPTAT